MKALQFIGHKNMCLGQFAGGRGGIALLDVRQREQVLDERFDDAPFDILFSRYEGTRHVRSACSEPFRPAGTERTDEGLRLEFLSDCGLRVEVEYRFVPGADVIRTSAEIRNEGGEKVRVSHFSWAHVGGIFGGAERPYEQPDRFKVRFVRSAWSGEGKLVLTDLNQLYLQRTTRHDSRACFDLKSGGSFVTEKLFPLVFLTDEEEGTVWYLQSEPAAPWRIRLRLRDFEQGTRSFLSLTADSGSEAEDGFFFDLAPGERYRTQEVLFGCTEGTVFDAVRELTTARRAARRERFPNKPVVFNDYMNCHWAAQNKERTGRLVEAVSRLKPDVFCLDSGWYKVSGEDWFGKLGDWEPSPELFGPEGLPAVIADIADKGMIPGVWFELEVCTPGAKAAAWEDSCFLMRGGRRIFQGGRYFFDLENPKVCRYLTECVRRLYEMGVRYLKNDYNASVGYGIDRPGLSPVYALERHARAAADFYRELGRTFPDLFLENCGSGAMREGYHILSGFDLQSTSDCELYTKYPAVIGGTLLYLLPELCGNWCYPYPQLYRDRENESFADEGYRAERADGEETIFNLVGGLVGVPYLSGRFDLADRENLRLIREALGLYRTLGGQIARSYPVFPLGASDFIDDVSPFAVGLRWRGEVLLAVWHKTGENTVFLPMAGIGAAEQIFPERKEGVSCRVQREGLRLSFSKPWQARLYRVSLSE